jgi:hypothetical protein
MLAAQSACIATERHIPMVVRGETSAALARAFGVLSVPWPSDPRVPVLHQCAVMEESADSFTRASESGRGPWQTLYITLANLTRNITPRYVVTTPTPAAEGDERPLGVTAGGPTADAKSPHYIICLMP